jgi:hypothetical protein
MLLKSSVNVCKVWHEIGEGEVSDRSHALVPEGYGRVPVLAYPREGFLLHHREWSDSMAMFQSFTSVSQHIYRNRTPKARNEIR